MLAKGMQNTGQSRIRARLVGGIAVEETDLRPRFQGNVSGCAGEHFV